jgi:hypothetical protein
MGQRPGHRRQKPSAGNPYAGRITCLRCDRQFWSWDRRQNRLCPRCKNDLGQEPSEEPGRRLPPILRRPRNDGDV